MRNNLRQQRNDALKKLEAAKARLRHEQERIELVIAGFPGDCPLCRTAGARYFAFAEIVRCPVCGLLDVSVETGQAEQPAVEQASERPSAVPV